MTTTNSANFKLKQYIERLERLEEEKKHITTNIAEIFAEAKSDGFDTKAMRQVLKLRKMKDNEVREQEMLVETYLAALEEGS